MSLVEMPCYWSSDDWSPDSVRQRDDLH